MNAKNNPDLLMKFANQLEEYVEYVDLNCTRIYHSLQELHNDWDDSQYYYLKDVLEEAHKQVMTFKPSANEAIQGLKNDANILYRYLNGKGN
jgi:bifunctional N-acetylglucosamine-1-phosphate-uridyltransferase/glucosamine-1-phosphate-acetyltransferase GlmU-like protein